MDNQIINPLINEIKEILDMARRNVARKVNNELIVSYWKIGEIIVRYEQNESIRAKYGERTLKQMSKALTAEFGKGFSRSNLQNMRAFYLCYENCQTLSGKLSWSHYCELLSVEDKDKRSFYEKEAINSNWSVRELKTSKLMPEAVGQLNMYLNYYENEVNDEDDNKPIGIILCTDKDALAAEYALGGLSSNILLQNTHIIYRIKIS